MSRYIILLVIIFCILCYMTFSLAMHIRDIELNELTRIDDSEFTAYVAEQLKSFRNPDHLISDSGILVKKYEKIPAAEREDIDSAYIKAVSFYKKKDFEKAIFYFDSIVDKYSKYLASFDEYYNPVLFSELFLYRIYRTVYSSTVPDRRIIQILMQNRADLSSLMIDSILGNNSDIFSVEDSGLIRKSACFHASDLLTRMDSSAEYEKNGLYLLHAWDREKRYLYLCDRSEKGMKVYIVDESRVISSLEEFRERMRKLDFELEYNVERSVRKLFDKVFCGIGYSVKINPKKLENIRERINRKLLLGYLVLIILYFVILFSTGRYISLLYRLQRIKDDFLNIISHELKTPLATIKLYSDTIINTRDPACIPRFAGIISSKTSQISNIVSNMIYFNKLSDLKNNADMKKKIRMNYAKMSLYPVVKKICEDCRNCYQKEYKLEFQNQEIELFTDENLFRIVLSNLVDNSFKHDTSGNVPAITIKLHETPAQTILEYQDSAVSLEKIDTVSIFRKFEMKPSGTSPSANLGLGLYIARNLVSLLGGTIEVSGEYSLKFIVKLDKEKNHEE